MPELPEVETIRRGLALRLTGQRIEAVESSGIPLRRPSPTPLADLAGRRVEAVRRHAKVLFWDLDDGATLSAHLGMTGKFLFAAPGEPRPSHTHLTMHLEDGCELRFVDPRRFGWLVRHAPGREPDDTAHYGIDALDPGFDAASLAALLASSGAPLKAFLLDQTKVAGLGNIYVCEALWRARLSPRRKACNTPKASVPVLHQAILDVLEDSLAAGGTSFNDYVDHLGRPGSFLFDVAVFRREGKPCPACSTPVQRIVQAGRSTFLCGTCQR